MNKPKQTLSRKHFQNLLNLSFSLFSRHAKSFLSAAFIFILPIAVLDLMLMYRQLWLSGIILSHHYLYNALRLFLTGLSGFYIFLFCIIIVKIIQHAQKGEDVPFQGAVRESWAVLKEYIKVKALVFSKVFLCGALLIVPGVVFGIFYSLAGMAFLVDGKKGMDALIFSKSLVKPNVVKYLDFLLYIVLFLFGPCLALILLLDLGITFYRTQGEFLMAGLINYLEWYILCLGAVFFLIFIYYFYQELKLRVQNVF